MTIIFCRLSNMPSIMEEANRKYGNTGENVTMQGEKYFNFELI